MELYIHIPFCVQKCRYCDFLSHAASEEDQKRYVNALCKEIEGWGRALPKESKSITSIFIGGGTPSAVPWQMIKKILETVREYFNIDENAEITMECNPGTVSEEAMKQYWFMGINRLSIGMQSADDKELKALGRIHDFRQFLTTFSMARACHFQNINIDIMTGLPGQTWAGLKRTLEKAAALHPEHISCYSLIIEPGTPFYDMYQEDVRKRELGEATEFLPDSDQEFLLYDNARTYLTGRGYVQYEVSNYAKEGYSCRHNKGYWNRTAYLGVGIGAASLLVDPNDPKAYPNLRFSAVRDTEEYIDLIENGFSVSEGIPCTADGETIEHLSQEDAMEEFMFLGLRMNEGIKTADFYNIFGRTVSNVYGSVIDKYIENGLMKQTREGCALTKTGMDVSNEVLADFLL